MAVGAVTPPRRGLARRIPVGLLWTFAVLSLIGYAAALVSETLPLVGPVLEGQVLIQEWHWLPALPLRIRG